MYVDDDEGHTDNKDVDENEKPNADKDDYDDKVEKEAEERLAAAAAAEEGEGSGPPPPTKVQARHAKKLSRAYILPWKNQNITDLWRKFPKCVKGGGWSNSLGKFPK